MRNLIYLLTLLFVPLMAFGMEMDIPNEPKEYLPLIGLGIVEFIIGKTKGKSNSLIELVLNGAAFLLKSLFAKKNNLLTFTGLLVVLVSLNGCGSGTVEEVKKVTAEGLGQGIYQVMSEEKLCNGQPVLICDRPDVAKSYFVQKSCEALQVDCGISSLGFKKSNKALKGALSRFACKAAVKMVMPAILPSKHLPLELKDGAGCRSACLDSLAQDLGPKLCEKL